ncbi:hypothetical protein [Cohaesibacter celericrescens]|nr:hypothetical protein [Cohaesibacter celericrescens]
MSFSRLLARLMMVPFGLILAILAAGIFLSFAVFSMDPAPASDPTVENAFTLFTGVFLAGTLGSIAFYPAILGLMITEFFSWRSLWIYLGFGLALSLFATHAPGEPVDSLAIALDMRALAAGLVGGFVYWLIAGRGAGIVQRTKDNRPKSL